MEYERIHKVQTGIISPSKLRMKLMGPHHSRKKDGSNSNSSRTSPSRLEDSEFVKNSLLASDSADFGEEASSLEVTSANVLSMTVSDSGQDDQTSYQSNATFAKENGEVGRVKVQQFSKAESGNSSAVHPMRTVEDENLDYDSNASSSSFEFHNERSASNQFARSFSRPMPSKWNDAEKWIMKRHNVQPNHSKKNALNNQANRVSMTNAVKVASDSSNYDLKSSTSRMSDTKLVDYCQSASQLVPDRFSFTPPESHSISGQAYDGNTLIDQCTQSNGMKEMDERSCTNSLEEDETVAPGIRSVCMRDMGTEMTPATSLEPSRSCTPRSCTPVDATTPLRSPTSSIPSTPRRGTPAPTPAEHRTDEDVKRTSESGKKQLTEQEMKEKTRREIVALGVQLGKMNIAAWASKEDQEKNTTPVDTAKMEELKRIEFEKRAAAWEDAEKARHTARYKSQEIQIQAWESQQKAKLEAEMRRIEARVDKMRAQAHAKMMKKIAIARKTSEEKRSAAEATGKIKMQKEPLHKWSIFDKRDECHQRILTCVVAGCSTTPNK